MLILYTISILAIFKPKALTALEGVNYLPSYRLIDKRLRNLLVFGINWKNEKNGRQFWFSFNLL
jgi:hypothetical protein